MSTYNAVFRCLFIMNTSTYDSITLCNAAFVRPTHTSGPNELYSSLQIPLSFVGKELSMILVLPGEQKSFKANGLKLVRDFGRTPTGTLLK